MTTNTQNLVDGFTKDELKLMLAEAMHAEKLVENASAQKFADTGAPLFADVIAGTSEKFSESSAWVGRVVAGMTFEVDGVHYSAKLTITNTDAQAARQPIVEHAKAVAKVNRLGVDGTKALIKAALEEAQAQKVEETVEG